MKKLLTLLFAVALTFSLAGASFAQTDKPADTKTEKAEKKAAKKKAKKEKKAEKKAEKKDSMAK